MSKYLTAMHLNSLLTALAVWIGALIAGSELMPNTQITLGVASFFLIYSGGSAIHVFFHADGKGQTSGNISRRLALLYSVLLFVAGITLSYFISFDALAAAIVAAGLFAAYSAQLKNTLLVGNLVTGGLLALAFAYGGIIAGNYTAALPLALLMLLAGVAKEIYKAIDDALADKKYSERSIAIRLGVHNARLIANIFLVVAVIFTFIPYFLGLLGVAYMFFAVLADIVFLSAAIAPARYGSKLVKIGMVVAVIAFLAGAYSLRV